MTESAENTSSKLTWILVGGIVSLIVGISSAWITSQLTSARPKLLYRTTSIQFFRGATNQVGVVAIEIHNPGQREIEKLECSVKFPKSKITESHCEGLPKNSFTLTSNNDEAQFMAPFFNPEEDVVLQFLVAPSSDQLEPPEINIRGKGIVGEIHMGTEARKSQSAPLLIGLGASYLAIVLLSAILMRTSETFRRRFQSLLGRSVNFGEQKDEFAFLLGAHGFVDYAKTVRGSSRDFSWWTLADELTESVLVSDARDSNEIDRAIGVLQDLIQFHNVVSSSIAKIHINIARLANAKQDNALAESSINLAKQLSKKVADFRCSVVSTLDAVENKGKIDERP